MVIGIIPARMDSSRFPGKPLAKICGIPMVGHVYLRSKFCKQLDEVYVATCDREISKYINSIGGKAIMTSRNHQRASDRAAEAMLKIEKGLGKKVDIVVMIQGDEPMITPKMITAAIKGLRSDKGCRVVNLMAYIKSKEEQDDPHEIKVAVDLKNYALYFSREPIPTRRKNAAVFTVYKQVCVIPFRRNFLIKFNHLEPTPLEKIESIDMLRILEHGYKVKMVLSKAATYSVDTIADLRKVTRMLKVDTLIRKYISR